ncbi:hypothetical protein F5882DRAFT_412104 [Hyaloscypha sp. PMI_1271]|nr:hypothetical protein F5882DRAFT_412104 [Hyaloscypha sp. PMI_1271]
MAIWHKPSKDVKITADIVFIHGLTGGRDSTWTAKGAEEPWPKLLLSDENDDEDDEDEKGPGCALKTARIMSWGYDADIVKLVGAAGQNRVMDHARNLLGALEDVREGSAANRPLIFIAHSLGGLVVKAALLRAFSSPEPGFKKTLECTRGIAFLGTPHYGSDKADLAHLLLNWVNLIRPTDRDIVRVLERDSEVNTNIRDEFYEMLRATNLDHKEPSVLVCFYEEKPMSVAGKTFFVVTKDSAKLGGYKQRGISGDHSSMTKYASQNDPGYKSVVAAIKRWMPTKDVPVKPSAMVAAEAAERRKADATYGGVVQKGASVGGSINTRGGSVSMNTTSHTHF